MQISNDVLCNALKSGDYEIIKAANLNRHFKNGDKPLHVAVKDNPDIIEYLLDFDAVSIDCQNRNGQTPLGVAILHEKSNAAKTLLEHNASPKKPDAVDETPLELAVCNKQKAMVLKLLLKEGEYDHRTRSSALIKSITDGSIQNVKIMVRQCEYKQKALQDALIAAIRKEDKEYLKPLLKAGAKLNTTTPASNGRTPLQIAVSINNNELVNYLIDQGADPTVTDTDGYNAFRYFTDLLIRDDRPTQAPSNFNSLLYTLLSAGGYIQSNYIQDLKEKREKDPVVALEYNIENAIKYYDKHNVPYDKPVSDEWLVANRI